jgi:quinoprotein dehydrogenase-associated probable ABC transporter substrate-binding protein
VTRNQTQLGNMKSPALATKLLTLLTVACGLAGVGSSGALAVEGHRSDLVNREVLRVCSDPANMPFSNQKSEGFENKIADIIGGELGVPVEYTWFPQAVGFTRNTLLAKRCDLIISTGQGDELVLNTNPLYRSAYALIYKPGTGLDGVDSLFDPRLKGKRVGVVIASPPADLVNKAGLMGNARPYRMMVDRRFDSPGEEMVKDIRKGDIDAGVLWGPMAGYFASHAGEKLTVVPLTKDAKNGRMEFRITMGVRRGDDLWKRQLNDVLRKRRADIDRVLLDYGVPLLDEDNKAVTEPRG